jgi:carotenoid 1,2-hydratase
VSDDGALSIVVIALLGNPFSPRYARARARGANPRALDFCALNVAVYGPDHKLWALHERPVEDAERGMQALKIGRSQVRWEGDALVVDIDEQTSPFARPLRGTVTFHPESSTRTGISLDARGLHTWWPVAPEGRIEVALEQPSLRFGGHGYHDANAGSVPLEASFSRWTWSRARVGDRRTCIAYAPTPMGSGEPSRTIHLDVRENSVRAMDNVCMVGLPRTRWRLDRVACADAAAEPRVLRELEDAPFYSRALVETQIDGRRVVAVHETLSLERFTRTWVQFLLQFRMRHG